MRRRAGVLVGLIVAGLVAVISPAAPAWACSCAYSDAEAERRAEQTVVGTVTEVTGEDVALAVESVEKGAARPGTTIRLGVSPGEASCGYDFRAGVRYRVSSTGGRTGLCSGNVESPPRPPSLGASATPVAAPPPADDSSGRSWWLAAGVTGAAAAVLAAAAVVLRRRRS